MKTTQTAVIGCEQDYVPAAYCKKSQRSRNPYLITDQRKKVRITPLSFKDARIYDSDIIEPGWEIQYSSARSKYRRYVVRERKNGDKNFKRIMREQVVTEKDEDGNEYQTVILVPVRGFWSSNRKVSPNSQSISLPRPKDAEMVGEVVDDVVDAPIYVPQMFTAKMGAEIQHTRNQLCLSQADVAKKINVNVGIIRDIERGGIVPFSIQDTMVQSLAKTLGLPTIKYQE